MILKLDVSRLGDDEHLIDIVPCPDCGGQPHGWRCTTCHDRGTVPRWKAEQFLDAMELAEAFRWALARRQTTDNGDGTYTHTFAAET